MSRTITVKVTFTPDEKIDDQLDIIAIEDTLIYNGTPTVRDVELRKNGQVAIIVDADDLGIVGDHHINEALRWIADELGLNVEELPCFMDGRDASKTSHKDGNTSVTFKGTF